MILKGLRDHIYRIRHYTLGDPLNSGKRIFYLWNYIRWLIGFKYTKRKFLIFLQNGYKSWVYPYPDHDAGEANIFTSNVDYYDNEFIRKCIAPGDFIVDAGCNVGNRTLVLADLISGALMIDANPVAICRVRENLKLNGLNESNYFLVRKAVGDKVGKVYFTDHGGASTQNSIADAVDESKRLIQVEMTTIDEELEAIKKIPSFIKVDVEGHDLLALKGAARTLASGRVKLVKFENTVKTAFTEMNIFFGNLGWEIFALDSQGIPVKNVKFIYSNPNLFAAPKIIADNIFKRNA